MVSSSLMTRLRALWSGSYNLVAPVSILRVVAPADQEVLDPPG
jgi:hypothetical protein